MMSNQPSTTTNSYQSPAACSFLCSAVTNSGWSIEECGLEWLGWMNAVICSGLAHRVACQVGLSNSQPARKTLTTFHVGVSFDEPCHV